MSDPFTPFDHGAPPADRFRLNDVWRAPNGRRYRVNPGLGVQLVTLQPLGGWGPPLHRGRSAPDNFQRLSWGGHR
jgi:hypothetical protein